MQTSVLYRLTFGDGLNTSPDTSLLPTSSAAPKRLSLRKSRKYDVTNEALHAKAPNPRTACGSDPPLRPILRSTRLLLASRRQKQCPLQGTIHGIDRSRPESRFPLTPRCLNFLPKTPFRHLRNPGSTPKGLRSLPHQYRARLVRDPSERSKRGS